MMDHEEWLLEIDSAERNKEWFRLRALAERRLAVAPADLNAILALKTANRLLDPTSTPASEHDAPLVITEASLKPRRHLPSYWFIICCVLIFSVLNLIYYADSQRQPQNNVAASEQRGSLSMRLKRGNATILYGIDEGERPSNMPNPNAYSPYSSISLGRVGWKSDACAVWTETDWVDEKNVFQDPSIFVAIPIPKDVAYKTISYTWTTASGDMIYDQRHVIPPSALASGCIKKEMKLVYDLRSYGRLRSYDRPWDSYKVKIRLDNDLVYDDIFYLSRSAMSASSGQDPFDNVMVGFSPNEHACSVMRPSSLRLKGNSTVFIMSLSVGKKSGEFATWALFGPDGNKVENGRLQWVQDFCAADSIFLGEAQRSGIYQLEVVHQRKIVHSERFELVVEE